MSDPQRPPPPPDVSGGWQPWQPPAPTPPPGPGWAAPQPQWGPTPGYGQPPPQAGNSSLAIVGGIVLLVLGVLVGLIGLAVLVVAAAGSELLADLEPELVGISSSAFAAVLMVIAVIMLVLALLNILAGIGIFMHKGWARWTGITAAVIGVIFGLLSLLGQLEGGATADVLFALVLLAAYGFVIVALAMGGEHFERRYGGR